MLRLGNIAFLVEQMRAFEVMFFGDSKGEHSIETERKLDSIAKGIMLYSAEKLTYVDFQDMMFKTLY